MPASQPRAEPIRPDVRAQAIAWYSLTQSGDASADQLVQLEQWRQSDSEHERAWQRMVGLPGLLRESSSMLRDPAARAALLQARYVNGDRRQALKLLAGVGALGAVGWQSKDSHWLQGSLADLSTAIGERRHHVLADGTQLWLNTATAVDIRFDAEQRRIVLRYGEINVVTGQDPAQRPLSVQTPDAVLRPLGTRFTVCCLDDGAGTRLSVSRGRVVATLRGRVGEQVVEAGQQASLGGGAISVSRPATLGDAWVDGFQIAQATRLGDLVVQLARYRRGILRCDPRVADLRVTGSYPLDDNERILALLEASLPVSIQRRTRYWVTIVPSTIG
jgi:transmembrane sensor